MPIPDFLGTTSVSVSVLRLLLVDRIRMERRRRKDSQRSFAELCGIPLRTYKRFEQGQCDSLDAFIRIVVAFERVKGFELMFPPKAVTVESRNPVDVLERVKARVLG